MQPPRVPAVVGDAKVKESPNSSVMASISTHPSQ
jgi:hypothetical protein